MEIKTNLIDGIQVFQLIGKLDVNTSPAVQGEVMEQILPGCRLVLDMNQCDYVSSAGLRALLIIAKQLAKVGGKGVLTGLLEEVKDVMEMTGFDNIFKNYDSLDLAAKALKDDKP